VEGTERTTVLLAVMGDQEAAAVALHRLRVEQEQQVKDTLGGQAQIPEPITTRGQAVEQARLGLILAVEQQRHLLAGMEAQAKYLASLALGSCMPGVEVEVSIPQLMLVA